LSPGRRGGGRDRRREEAVIGREDQERREKGEEGRQGRGKGGRERI